MRTARKAIDLTCRNDQFRCFTAELIYKFTLRESTAKGIRRV